MATVLYINPDSQIGPPRATNLGCGWMPAVPPQFASVVTSLPAVVVAGQGIVTVIPDSPPTSQATVASALAPILAAEQAAAVEQATDQANADATASALSTAMTRLTGIINQGNTLAQQSTAWTVAQQKAAAQALSDMALIERRLIREAISLRDASD